MYACGTGPSNGMISGSGVSYVYVQGNTWSYSGATVAQAGTLINVTSFSGTSGTITFTNSGTNGLIAGQTIAMGGFTGPNVNLNVPNGPTLVVFSAGLSNTTFEATVTGSGYSSGTGQAHVVEGNGAEFSSSSNHILMENNDASHYTLNFCCGDQTYFVIRNNNCHDQYETEAGGNAHTDCFYWSPNVTTAEIVVEGNYQYNGIGPNAKGILNQGEYSPCLGACGGVMIIRYNTVNHIGSGNTSSYGWSHFVVYSNTYYDIGYLCSSCAGGGDNFLTDTYPMKAWADLNNIWYFPSAQTVTGIANPVASDSASNANGFNTGYNLAYCNASGSSNCALFGHLYESGSWTGDTGNILGYIGHSPTNDPKFVSNGSELPSAIEFSGYRCGNLPDHRGLWRFRLRDFARGH